MSGEFAGELNSNAFNILDTKVQVLRDDPFVPSTVEPHRSPHATSRTIPIRGRHATQNLRISKPQERFGYTPFSEPPHLNPTNGTTNTGRSTPANTSSYSPSSLPCPSPTSSPWYTTSNSSKNSHSNMASQRLGENVALFSSSLAGNVKHSDSPPNLKVDEQPKVKALSPTAAFLHMVSQKSEIKSDSKEDDFIEIETEIKKFVMKDTFETLPRSNFPMADHENLKSLNRQNLIVFLLQRVCAFIDHTPKTFILNCLKMQECGILTSLDFLSQPSWVSKAQDAGIDLDHCRITNGSTKNEQHVRRDGFNGTPGRLNMQNATQSKAEPIVDEALIQDFPIFHFDEVSGKPRTDFTLSRYKKDFQSLKLIGRGAFGKVYMALHKLDGVQYAIKQIKFSNVGFTPLIHRKVLREVKNLARLDHPNICRYYNAWIEPIWDDTAGSTQSTRVVEISNSNTASSEMFSRSGGAGEYHPFKNGTDFSEKNDSQQESGAGVSGRFSEACTNGGSDAKIEALIPYSNYFHPYLPGELDGDVFEDCGSSKSSEGGALGVDDLQFHLETEDEDSHLGLQNWEEANHFNDVSNGFSHESNQFGYSNISQQLSAGGISGNKKSFGGLNHENGHVRTRMDGFDFRTQIGGGGAGVNIQEISSASGSLPHLQRVRATENNDQSEFSSSVDSSDLLQSPICIRRKQNPPKSNNEVRSIVNLAESLKYHVMLYIQTQLCGPDSLKTLLSSKRVIQVDLLMNIFHQILCGLEHIHKRGIVHRDLKPENIFLWEDPLLPTSTSQEDKFLSRYTTIKIGDFGLSRDITDVSVSEFSAQELQASIEEVNLCVPEATDTLFMGDLRDNHTRGVGTRTYASPEQVEGKLISAASDIYSLGVILFELFNTFQTGMERAMAITDLRKQKMDVIFENEWTEQARIIRTMTDLDPRKRPTAAELLADDAVMRYSHPPNYNQIHSAPVTPHISHWENPPPVMPWKNGVLPDKISFGLNSLESNSSHCAQRSRSLSPRRIRASHQDPRSHPVSRRTISTPFAPNPLIGTLSKDELVSRVETQENIISEQAEEIARLTRALEHSKISQLSKHALPNEG